MSERSKIPSISESDLVAALLRPEAYPHAIASETQSQSAPAVETRRTHLSLVFLASDFAYKLKRHLDLGFVDFTSIEARRDACIDEVRLNRRLAPSVYLGVVAIVRDASGAVRIVPHDDGGEGEIDGTTTLDFAVRMRRLDEQRLLNQLLANDAIEWDDLVGLGDLIAGFLESRERDPIAAEFGSPDAVRAKFLNHLDRMTDDRTPQDEPHHPPTLVDHLRRWTESWLARHDELLRRRVASGHVREGHGDLHSANIALIDGKWLVLDCVEFRRDFRCLDSAAEIAVLTMDIAHHTPERASASAWGRALRAHLGTALRLDSDELESLYRAYASHYAAVRAHVGSLGAWSTDDESNRASAVAAARGYLAHAVGLTLPPQMIVMCGLPGSGKSVVAKQAARALEATLISSDLTRKALAGLAPTDRSGEDRSGHGGASSIYTSTMTTRTLACMLDGARDALRAGRSVVIDATNARRAWRDAFDELAREAGVQSTLVWLDLPDATIRRRLRARRMEHDQPSDADERIYDEMLSRFERPDEWPFERLVPILEPLPTEAIVERMLIGMFTRSGS